VTVAVRAYDDEQLERSSRFEIDKPLVALSAISLLLIGLPALYLIFGALWSTAPGATGGHFTLANFAATYGHASFWLLMLNTLAVAVGSAAVSVVLGTAGAWVVTRSDIPRAKMWEGLLAIPLYLSPLMLALAWIALAAPRSGVLNALSQHLGGPGTLVSCYSLVAIVWVLGGHYTAYVFLYMLAPMRAIDSSFEEAALVLGSSRWGAIRSITLRLLWPGMLASGIMVATLAAENFPVPALLGAPFKFNTIPSEIYYWLAYDTPQPNLAAAAGSALVLLSLIGIIFYQRTAKQASRFVTVSGKPRPIVKTKLGRARGPAGAILALYFAFSVVIPVVVLVFYSFMRFFTTNVTLKSFTLSNYVDALSRSNVVALRNSITLSVGTATITVLLGGAISYFALRGRSKARGVLDYFTLTGAAIPGIVLGVGMLWAYVGIPLPIYGTIWILFIAYVARFLGHSVRTSASALLHVSTEFEEAAQVLGARPLRRWRDIVFPLIARGLTSAWIIVFIFTLNEVSASIVLYSPQSITLPVVMAISMQQEGAIQAFAYASLQALIVFAALAVLGIVVGKISDPAAAVERI
jgi:iron(III) transport system permease protein